MSPDRLSAFDREEARSLAWKGRTIHERVELLADLSLDPEPVGEADGDADDPEVLSDWREEFADGPDGAFEHRLATEGLDGERCRRSVMLESAPEGTPLPGWVRDLDEFVTSVGEAAAPPVEPESEPFGEAVVPWVGYAHERLRERTDLDRFSPAAVESLARWLVERFVEVAAEALFLEFRTFAVLRNPALLGGPAPEAAESTELYESFAEGMADPDRLRELFVEYPFLGRLVVTTIRQWIAAVEELHDAVERDWADLSATFGPFESGVVEDLAVLTDDRHGDGRAVVRVEFDGATVVFKPRSIECERVFFGIVEDVAGRIDADLLVPECVSGDGYGWMEWVSQEDAASQADVERYYRRAGVLLAVSYVLSLNDSHYENVIAHGSHPVIVDAETILQPEVREIKESSEAVAMDEVRESIFVTDLVPWEHHVAFAGHPVKFAGFSDPEFPSKPPLSSPARWENPNTDAMALRDEDPTPGRPEGARNLPTVDGERVDPGDYRDDVAAGFGDAYEALAASPVLDELADRAADLDTRVLFGATFTYAQVLEAVTGTDCLADAAHATVHLEGLVTHLGFGDGSVDESWLDLYRCERRAIKRLDVPRFTVDPDGRSIQFDDERIPGPIETPGTEVLAARRDSLGPADERTQRRYVEFSYRPDSSPVLEGTGRTTTPTVEEGDRLSPAELRAGTESICRDVLDAARPDGDGNPEWLVRTEANSGLLHVGPIYDYLTEGRTGIALFFAMAGAAYGDSDYSRTALDVLAPVRERIPPDPDGEDPLYENVGLASGAGGYVYALTKMGTLLDESRLVDDALAVARSVREDDVVGGEVDLMAGSTGLLLGLLSLYEVREEEWLLDLARTCGRHAVDERVETSVGHRAWQKELASRPLTGFSHGASGVALALSRLADRVDDPEAEYRAAAEEGLAYERAVYSPERENWPDFRTAEDSRHRPFAGETADVEYTDAWCHGRTGAVLARLELAERGIVPDDPGPPVDAIRTSIDGVPDHLCCGNAGRIDALLRAGTLLDDDRYVRRAHATMAAVHRRRSDAGCYALRAHSPEIYDPTLFNGTAGIGYALLRLQYPDEIPCVLTWE